VHHVTADVAGTTDDEDVHGFHRAITMCRFASMPPGLLAPTEHRAIGSGLDRLRRQTGKE
jgi:hypothetical protein